MKNLLTKRIERLKQKLDKLIETHGTQNNQVLKCSQELDILIFNSYKKGSYGSNHRLR